MSSGYVGIDKDYFVSVKEVLNITAETGALETQDRVRELPPADVVEVRHGHWQTDRYGNLLCSECKGFALYLETGCYVNRHMEQHKSDYCPNCGARMDGESNE